MNNTVKSVLIFALGASMGSGVTYFVVRKRAQKDADKQIAEFRAYYDEKTRPYRVAEQMNEAAEKVEETKIVEIYGGTEPDKDENYTVYTDYAAKKAENEHPRDEIPGPRVISEDEFCDAIPYYAKVSLWYDKDSGRLIDQMTEQEEQIDTIGQDILDGMIRDNQNVIYVRNDSISIDYEVEMI